MKEGEAVDCGISFAAAQLRRTGSGSGRKTDVVSVGLVSDQEPKKVGGGTSSAGDAATAGRRLAVGGL